MVIISKRGREAREKLSSQTLTIIGKNDPISFIEKHIAITSHATGSSSVPSLIKLWDCQKDYIEAMELHRLVTLASCRGGGTTTASIAYMLWCAATKFNHRMLMVFPYASQQGHAVSLIKTLSADMNLPPMTISGTCFKFQTGCEIQLSNHTTLSTVGRVFDTIIFDCFANIDVLLQQRVLDNCLLSLHIDGNIAVTSTPSSAIDIFAALWEAIHAGVIPGEALRTTYFDLPYATQHGWNLLSSLFSDDTLKQQYGAEFI